MIPSGLRFRVAVRPLPRGPGLLLLLVAGSVIAPPAQGGERVGLEVRETGGFARRGYPAHALLNLPRPVPPGTKLRLALDGKPVVAQFWPEGDGPTARWWLD